MHRSENSHPVQLLPASHSSLQRQRTDAPVDSLPDLHGNTHSCAHTTPLRSCLHGRSIVPALRPPRRTPIRAITVRWLCSTSVLSKATFRRRRRRRQRAVLVHLHRSGGQESAEEALGTARHAPEGQCGLRLRLEQPHDEDPGTWRVRRLACLHHEDNDQA